LLLSRQNLSPQVSDSGMTQQIEKGGYVLSSDQRPRIVLMATGSELSLAVLAASRLREQGVGVRVVSVPSTTVFDQQSVAYKQSVLPPEIPRVVVEAGVTDFWWKYQPAAVLGLDRYGESAPAGELFQYFRITADELVATVQAVLGRPSR